MHQSVGYYINVSCDEKRRRHASASCLTGGPGLNFAGPPRATWLPSSCFPKYLTFANFCLHGNILHPSAPTQGRLLPLDNVSGTIQLRLSPTVVPVVLGPRL